MRIWPFGRRRDIEQRNYTLTDPAFAALLGGHVNVSGQTVSETTALTLSAVWRSVSLVAGAVAGLPIRTLADSDGLRERTGSFLDNPAGPDRATPFEWAELVMVHLLLHGNAFLLHIYNGGGALVGLQPVHPLAVGVDATSKEALEAPGGKLFTVSLINGEQRIYSAMDMTHIMALSTDGIRGLSPISVARNSLGTGMAGDKAAARMFSSGAMISGLVTTEDDVTEDEAKLIKASLSSKLLGEENAGDIAFVNRNLKFTPWQLSAEDAQFLQSRTFQIEEIGRWFGVPPHLLGQTEKATSWGTGIEEQNRGLARYTLAPWTNRIQGWLSRLIPVGKFCEFDYSALLQPSPEDEINLLVQQVTNGLITPNEARRIRNMPPIAGGDTLRLPPGSIPAAPLPSDAEPEQVPADV